MTALNVAAINGHAAIVDLLENGAEMDASDNHGRTPLVIVRVGECP